MSGSYIQRAALWDIYTPGNFREELGKVARRPRKRKEEERGKHETEEEVKGMRDAKNNRVRAVNEPSSDS